jgi:shikimate dehydrogenase
MHQAALNRCSLKGEYLPLEIKPDDLHFVLSELFLGGYNGLNVTTPHKTAVMPFVKGLSEEAKTIGSVNTLLLSKEGFFGENTDALGFQAAYLDQLADTEGKRALVLGSGGAARAVLIALKRQQIKPVVSARDPLKAFLLAQELGVGHISWGKLAVAGPFDFLVNSTTASSRSEFGPKPPTTKLAKDGLIIDINYGRMPNYFAELAEKKQVGFRDGMGMLANQARLSFRHWTGKDPGIEPFLTALESFIQKSRRAAN